MQKYPTRRRAVAAVLRDARVAAGLSQRQLSAKLGEVVNYAYAIEKERQPIRAEELIAWAEACGTRGSAILKEAEQLLAAQEAAANGLTTANSPTAAKAIARARAKAKAKAKGKRGRAG